MKQQPLSGIWLLKNRDEVYSDEELKKDFNRVLEEFIVPEKEILYFTDWGDLVIQMGLRNRTKQEHSGLEPDKFFEVSYYIPGQYDTENGKIFIADMGTFYLKDNSLMYVTKYNEDYICRTQNLQLSQQLSSTIDNPQLFPTPFPLSPRPFLLSPCNNIFFFLTHFF